MGNFCVNTRPAEDLRGTQVNKSSNVTSQSKQTNVFKQR